MEERDRCGVAGGAVLGAAENGTDWDTIGDGTGRTSPASASDQRDPRPGRASSGNVARLGPIGGARTADEGSGVSRRRLLVAVAAGMTSLAGCSNFGDSDSDASSGDDDAAQGAGNDERAIRSVIETNARTLETEDLDAHMETIHPESPLYDSTESTTGQLLEQYDVTVDVEIESVEIDGDTATVETVQTTRETSGAPGYQDVRVDVTHELRTHEGEWKIYGSTIEDRERV